MLHSLCALHVPAVQEVIMRACVRACVRVRARAYVHICLNVYCVYTIPAKCAGVVLLRLFHVCASPLMMLMLYKLRT
jgi:hypothetical protein